MKSTRLRNLPVSILEQTPIRRRRAALVRLTLAGRHAGPGARLEVELVGGHDETVHDAARPARAAASDG